MRIGGGKQSVSRSTLRIQTNVVGDRLKERRFAAAVFTDEERYLLVKPQPFEICERSQRKWILAKRQHLFAVKHKLK